MATAKDSRAKVRTSAPAPKAKPKSDTPLVLVVTPKVEGFRRAGFAFSGETRLPLNELSDKQYEQLIQEPMLVTYLAEAEAVADTAEGEDEASA
jgi:hypothetical protein